MHTVESVTRQMKITNLDMKRLIEKSFIKPHKFTRNSKTDIFLDSEMVKRIKAIRCNEVDSLLRHGRK
jgi:hypothetical protein